MRRNDCEEGRVIVDVSRGGRLIVLDGGILFAPASWDAPTVMVWVPGDEVVVCGDRIVNVDEADVADGTRIR